MIIQCHANYNARQAHHCVLYDALEVICALITFNHLMRVSSIEEQTLQIIKLPLILVSVSLIIAALMLLDFHLDVVRIVIGLALLVVAVLASLKLADTIAKRVADHIGSAFDLLHVQMNSALVSEREFDFHSDVKEAMEIADSAKKLMQRTLDVREEMKGLEEVRSQFLANVSHELRTPVFAIQGYLETLLEGAENDERVRHTFIEKASANATRLNVLLGDLIDISRIESGEMRMSFRYFNIVDVARDVISSLEGLAKQYTVSLRVDSPVDESLVLGDKERIIQVMVNLVSNAIRYNKASGEVVIRVHNEAQATLVSIEDTGLGIAPEHQQRIFERFYRIDANRSRSTGGSGLGLAIVKHILEAHDTVPIVQSEENVGTTISFRLRR